MGLPPLEVQQRQVQTVVEGRQRKAGSSSTPSTGDLNGLWQVRMMEGRSLSAPVLGLVAAAGVVKVSRYLVALPGPLLPDTPTLSPKA